MAILEAQDKMVTEIESEVDVQVNLNHDGLTFSLYIDEEHFNDDVTWDLIADSVLDDYIEHVITDDELRDMIDGLGFLVKELKDARRK